MDIKIFCYLTAILVFVSNLERIEAQDISGLLKNDYNRKELLLIQSSLRKKMGSNSNSPKVRQITKDLLPWSMMEGFTPEQFSQAIIYLYETDKAGIPFESNEDLLPYLPNFTGSSEDFILISRFFREVDRSNLPSNYRDELLKRATIKNWTGASILFAGRLLILSRQEDIPTNKYLDDLVSKMPKNLNSLSSAKTNQLILSLTQDFASARSNENIEKILASTENVKRAKQENLVKQLAGNSRSMDTLFQELGDDEVRMRPKLELSPEDLGIIPESSTSQSPSTGAGSTSTLTWKQLNPSKLEKVVRGWLGTKYVYGGNTKSGTDCSGFTQAVLIDPAISTPKSLIPRSAATQSRIGNKIPRDSMRVGDLVFFSASANQSKITHVGLVLEDGKFSHASSSRGVVIQGLSEKWWKDRYVTSRRIFEKILK